MPPKTSIDNVLLSQHFASLASIGLIGSCVARELKQVACDPDVEASYLWRSSTVSMATPPAQPAIPLDQLELEGPSLKTVSNDFQKTALADSILKNSLVIMDFFRDTYDLFELENGAYITFGKELANDKMQQLFPNSKFKSVYDADYPNLWFESMRRISKIINESDSIIVIVPSIASYGTFSKNRFDASPIDAFDAYYKHAMLEFMERIAVRMLNKSILLQPLHAGVSCDPNHIYGLGAFHHYDDFYSRMLAINDAPLDKCLKRNFPKRYDLAECDRIMGIWRSIAAKGYPLMNRR